MGKQLESELQRSSSDPMESAIDTCAKVYAGTPSTQEERTNPSMLWDKWPMPTKGRRISDVERCLTKMNKSASPIAIENEWYMTGQIPLSQLMALLLISNSGLINRKPMFAIRYGRMFEEGNGVHIR